MKDHSVVVPWKPGAYHFRHRWQAALFRFSIRRCNGWTWWDVLSDAEKAKKVTFHIRRRWVFRSPIRWDR